jgi:hypothetical protein
MGELRIVQGRVVEDGPPLRAEFYEHAKKVGIGKWEPTVYFSLKAPGVRDWRSREATEQDKLDHPEAWKRFQQGVKQSDEGTGLTQLPAHKTAFEFELRAMGVDTVEGLALLDEPPAEHLIGMWKQARMFVQLSESDDGQEV